MFVRRDHALPDGVVPVLNAQMTTEQWVVGVRRRRRRRRCPARGAQLCVDHDAVVCRKPGGHGQGGVGQHADPDHDQVGLERRPVCQADDGRRPRRPRWPRPGRRSAGRRRVSRCTAAKMPATSGPRTRSREGRASPGRSHRRRRRRAAAATSRPIQPPPDDHEPPPRRAATRAGRRPRACAGRRPARQLVAGGRAGGAAGTGREQQPVVADRGATVAVSRVRRGRVDRSHVVPSRRSTSWSPYHRRLDERLVELSVAHAGSPWTAAAARTAGAARRR